METYVPYHASAGRRFLNALIDWVGYVAALFIVAIIVGIGWGEAGAKIFDGATGYLVNLAAFLAYYTVLEATWGRTLGKLITGTMVVNEHGRKPTFMQALGRSAARFIPFEPFSVLLEDNHRGWHDSLAKTFVVQVRGVPANKALQSDVARPAGERRG